MSACQSRPSPCHQLPSSSETHARLPPTGNASSDSPPSASSLPSPPMPSSTRARAPQGEAQAGAAAQAGVALLRRRERAQPRRGRELQVSSRAQRRGRRVKGQWQVRREPRRTGEPLPGKPRCACSRSLSTRAQEVDPPPLASRPTGSSAHRIDDGGPLGRAERVRRRREPRAVLPLNPFPPFWPARHLASSLCIRICSLSLPDPLCCHT